MVQRVLQEQQDQRVLKARLLAPQDRQGQRVQLVQSQQLQDLQAQRERKAL